MNDNTHDHERAARLRAIRRRTHSAARHALDTISHIDPENAAVLSGYINLLTLEADIAAAEEGDTPAPEADALSRVDLAADARSGERESGGLSTRHPHTVANTGIEGADLLG